MQTLERQQTKVSENPTANESLLQPENGLAGLKHFRYDFVAGIVVSLVSLPLSLGIAIASGAPPIAGLISAIIAGLVFPFLGGAYVTISGPAAGLAPVLLASMLALGNHDLAKGYPLLLGAISIAGAIQVILSRMGIAKWSAILPNAVVKGMLAAIGLSIIAKQFPNILGHPFKAHDFFPMLAELPSAMTTLNPNTLILFAICAVTVFTLAGMKAKWTKIIPPQLCVVVLGIILGQILHLSGKSLINIPANPLAHGIVLPDWQGLFASTNSYWTIAGCVIAIMLVDGIESLATIGAIDKIDPFRRKSNPDRTLFAMGMSNIFSSMVGGLTIIPGGIKSTACIVSGGRTLWANFYNAICLILYLCLGRELINMIPIAALSAILVQIGFKLCKPAIWRDLARISNAQVIIFASTIAVTLCSDLLYGIAFGLIVEFCITLYLLKSAPNALPLKRQQGLFAIFNMAAQLFKSPIAKKEVAAGESHIYLSGPVCCFNSLHVSKEVASVPSDVSKVYLHVTKMVPLVDYTAGCDLLNLKEQRITAGRPIQIHLDGCGEIEKKYGHAMAAH